MLWLVKMTTTCFCSPGPEALQAVKDPLVPGIYEVRDYRASSE